MAHLLQRPTQGDDATAAGCLALAEVSGPHDAALWELGALLGSKAGSVMHAGDDSSFLDRIAREAHLPPQVWTNSASARALILGEGSVYESIIPQLVGLAMPALLLKGEHDPITCEKQVEAFSALAPPPVAIGSGMRSRSDTPLRCWSFSRRWQGGTHGKSAEPE